MDCRVCIYAVSRAKSPGSVPSLATSEQRASPAPSGCPASKSAIRSSCRPYELAWHASRVVCGRPTGALSEEQYSSPVHTGEGEGFRDAGGRRLLRLSGNTSRTFASAAIRAREEILNRIPLERLVRGDWPDSTHCVRLFFALLDGLAQTFGEKPCIVE